MKKNTSRVKFFEVLNKAMKDNGAFINDQDIRSLADGFDITPDDAVLIWDAKKIAASSLDKVMESDDPQKEIFQRLDYRMSNMYPDIAVFMRGENIEFYRYEDGYYHFISDVDMENLVYKTMSQLEMLEYRCSSRVVRDTVRRFGAVLCNIADRHFSDERIIKQEWRINVSNGLLDTSTLILEPHRRDYFSTSQAPFPYTPTAEAPHFESFINEVICNDQESKDLLQEIMGYCLTNSNPRHKIFYLFGMTARNGKSTFGKILCGLVGNGASYLSLDTLTKENTPLLVPLIGSQINFSDELSSKYMDSPRLASISAEGNVMINPKYKKAFDYQVRTKIVVACNDLPKFADSQGMLARTVVVYFGAQIPEERRIFNLDRVLLSTEGSGILNWAIAGLNRLNKQGVFTYGSKSRELFEENELANNYVLAYIEDPDLFEYDIEYKVENDISANELFGYARTNKDNATGYFAFCEGKNVKTCSRWSFDRELSRIAELSDTKIRKIKSNGYMKYRGIKKANQTF